MKRLIVLLIVIVGFGALIGFGIELAERSRHARELERLRMENLIIDNEIKRLQLAFPDSIDSSSNE